VILMMIESCTRCRLSFRDHVLVRLAGGMIAAVRRFLVPHADRQADGAGRTVFRNAMIELGLLTG